MSSGSTLWHKNGGLYSRGHHSHVLYQGWSVKPKDSNVHGFMAHFNAIYDIVSWCCLKMLNFSQKVILCSLSDCLLVAAITMACGCWCYRYWSVLDAFTIGFWNGHYLAFFQSPTCHQLGAFPNYPTLAEEPLERPGNCTYMFELMSSVHTWNHIIAPHVSMWDLIEYQRLSYPKLRNRKYVRTSPGTSLGIPQNSHKTLGNLINVYSSQAIRGHHPTTGCDMVKPATTHGILANGCAV